MNVRGSQSRSSIVQVAKFDRKLVIAGNYHRWIGQMN